MREIVSRILGNHLLVRSVVVAIVSVCLLSSCCTTSQQLERQTDTNTTLSILDPSFDLSGFGKIESGFILGKLQQDLMAIGDTDSVFHFVSVPSKKKNDTLEVFVNPKNNFTHVSYKTEPDTTTKSVITRVEKIVEPAKTANNWLWFAAGIVLTIIVMLIIILKK
jgi:hypothetical protein